MFSYSLLDVKKEMLKYNKEPVDPLSFPQDWGKPFSELLKPPTEDFFLSVQGDEFDYWIDIKKGENGFKKEIWYRSLYAILLKSFLAPVENRLIYWSLGQ